MVRVSRDGFPSTLNVETEAWGSAESTECTLAGKDITAAGSHLHRRFLPLRWSMRILLTSYPAPESKVHSQPSITALNL
jgi:hypothetical protein